MKNLFLALLAMVAIVACNNNDGLEFGFDITIGPSGEYSVSGARTVSSEEFADKVIGAGWVRKAFHYVNDNGSIDPINQDAQEDVLGYPTVFIYFENDHQFKYAEKTAVTYIGKIREYLFRNSSINILDTDEHIQTDYYQVVDITENKLTMIRCTTYYNTDNQLVHSSSYQEFERMSEEQLNKFKETFQEGIFDNWQN